jgi:hypothetical protein
MCNQCEKKPVYEFTNQRKLCKSCFISYFQKKFLYTLRKFEMTKKGDVVGYENKGDFRNVVLEDLLKMYSSNNFVQIVKLPSKKKITKKVLNSTIDSESLGIIQGFINEKKINLNKFSPVKIKEIKPLYLFLDAEVLLYAKLKNLKFKKIQEKKDKISNFISELEQKHPEIKRAVINQYLELK